MLYCGDSPLECAARYLRASLSKSHVVRYVDIDTDIFPVAQVHESDVIILSDVGIDQLGTASNVVGEFTSNGGGLLMIGGFASFAGHDLRGNYHNTEVEKVLPILCSPSPDDIAVYRGFHPRAVDKNHPIFQGIPWNDFPVLVGYNRVILREGADLLLEYSGDPVLAVREVGNGRSAAFTSDCAPHWCGGLVDWPYYDKFWSRIIRWLAKEV